VAITTVFDISKQALLNSQSAIDTTAKNITNVNTEGYKRRRVETSNYLGIRNTSSNLDQDDLSRIRNTFIDHRLLMEQENLGKYETSGTLLNNIESIFGEPLESGLGNIMSEFWNAWNDLANDPESQTAKTVVKDQAVMLTNTFNRLYANLQDLQQQIDFDINEKTNEVNQLLQQVDSLNRRLSTHSSADILDQRDAVINKLSKLVDIDVRENSSHEITISLDGQILISQNYSADLIGTVSYENGFSSYEFRLENGQTPLNIDGGSLGALLEINNQNIPDYIDQLNILATTLANRVNQIHNLGYNSNGENKVNFFEPNIQEAADIQVSSDILDDPSLIATAKSAGSSGDNTIALAICNIQNEKLINGSTLSDFYNALISTVGSQVNEASFMTQSQTKIVENLQNQQDAISGISLDEELAALIEYENTYQAASRLIKTADIMIESLLNVI
jgi:flagellar hook-associated protein 1 FlgK